METVMTAKELASRCNALATTHKTLYILGCFGAPMTAKNRKRYTQNYTYNAQPDRAAKIGAADENTFGFDCVCMIKGILWGWNGDKSKTYGGAKYQANGVPDAGADSMFRKCREQSKDFSCIEVGEALWRSGHIGIYIGDGLAVECTPKWADGVQITAVNKSVPGYPTRTWTSHGKLPYVSYEAYSLARFRMEVGLVTDALPRLSETENRVHILVCLTQKRLGFRTEDADGVFGPVTRAAVEAFQKERSLPVTGAVDEATWTALLEEKAHG